MGGSGEDGAALPFADTAIVIETRRSTDFSPVKRAWMALEVKPSLDQALYLELSPPKNGLLT